MLAKRWTALSHDGLVCEFFDYCGNDCLRADDIASLVSLLSVLESFRHRCVLLKHPTFLFERPIIFTDHCT